MSCNNFILIRKVKNTYRVEMHDAECGFNHVIGKSKTLEEAIKLAQQEEQEYIDNGSCVEYGIEFDISG